MNQDCVNQIREMYKLYTGMEIAEAIKVVRAEMTEEEFRHDLQREILDKQAQLNKLTQKK
jgi:hypothetical protein